MRVFFNNKFWLGAVLINFILSVYINMAHARGFSGSSRGRWMGIGLGGLHTRHVYLHQAMLFCKDDLEYNNMII